MNKFKKFAATVIAAATVLTGMSFPVSATTYDCDVNDDGAVTVADVTAISKYLVGNLKVPDYNRLDTNKSLTVDNMDVQCVLAEMMDWSYDCDYFSRATQQYSNAPSVSTFNPDADANLTAARGYWKYSYKNNKATPYVLRPSSTTLNTGISTYSVIKTDDRYLANGAENTGIVSIQMLCDGYYYYGTGFIVGDHQIATVAHCVYKRNDDGEGTWMEPINITAYNSNGTLSSTTFNPIEAHIPIEYNEQAGKYDFALITVSDDLSNYVQFDLGTSYNVNISNFSNIPLYVTGCPGIAETGTNSSRRLYSAEGKVANTNNNTEILHYNADTSSGESGSPVYTLTRNIVNGTPSYSYTALAIHSFGGGSVNSGALITKYHLQFFKNNSNASWEE